MWIEKHSAQYVPLQYIPKFWYMEMQVFNSEGDSATLVLVSEKDINLHGVLSCSLRNHCNQLIQVCPIFLKGCNVV
jgi:hypothetical protein